VSGPVPATLASEVRERLAQFGIPAGIGERACEDAEGLEDAAINNPSETSRAIPVTRLGVVMQRRRRTAGTIVSAPERALSERAPEEV
jgi:hypothetical protein